MKAIYIKAIYIEDTGGTRRVETADFPLAVRGSTSGAVHIEPSSTRDQPSQPPAFIGLAEGELFVQPADTTLPVLCNGTPLNRDFRFACPRWHLYTPESRRAREILFGAQSSSFRGRHLSPR